MMKNLIQKWMARRGRHAFIVATVAATQRELLFTQPVGAINQGSNFMDVGFRERKRKIDHKLSVRIVTYGLTRGATDACKVCEALYGKRLTIDEALSEMPIPTLCEFG